MAHAWFIGSSINTESTERYQSTPTKLQGEDPKDHRRDAEDAEKPEITHP